MGKEHPSTTRRRSRRKKHLHWMIRVVTPRTGPSGAVHEGEATTPTIGTSGKWGQKRMRNDKKTPSGSKEKEELKEYAPELDHPWTDAPDWII